jgi:hypothetical protein
LLLLYVHNWCHSFIADILLHIRGTVHHMYTIQPLVPLVPLVPLIHLLGTLLAVTGSVRLCSLLLEN